MLSIWRFVWLSSIVTLTLLSWSPGQIHAQFFNPHLNDVVYLHRIESQIASEVQETQNEMMEEAGVLRNLTEAYIDARLKANFYQAFKKLSKERIPAGIKPNKDGTNFLTKFPKQADSDYDGENETVTDILNLAVKLNSIALKQLLVVPHFLRQSIKKILHNNAAGNATSASNNTQKLAVKEDSVNPQKIQLLNLLSLLADAKDPTDPSESGPLKLKENLVGTSGTAEKLERKFKSLFGIPEGTEKVNIFVGSRDEYLLLDQLGEFLGQMK